MKIRNSLDWSIVETDLIHKSKNLTHSREIKRMINNISLEVTTLSKQEVLERNRKSDKSSDILNKINEDIELVEEYILVAALIG